MRRALLVALCLVTLAPAGANFPIAQTIPFPHLGGPSTNVTLLTGGLTVATGSTEGAYGIVNLTAPFTITGIQQIAWDPTNPSAARQSASGSLSVTVMPGGSVGFDPGMATSATLSAPYAVALPLDPAIDWAVPGERGVHVGPSLAAFLSGGGMTMANVTVPPTTFSNPHGAALLALNPQTSLVVRDGSALLATAHGAAGFTGRLHFSTVAAEAYLVPFTAQASAHVSSASPQSVVAASKGVSFTDIQRDLAILGNSKAAQLSGNPLAGVQDILYRVLNPGMFQLAMNRTGNPDLHNLTLARGGSYDLAVSGTLLSVTGSAPLALQNGRVAGAKPMVVLWRYVALPAWSIALWVVALALFVAVLILHRPKKSERWDRYRWVGRVATLAAFLVLAWLWNRHMGDLLGVNATSSGLSTQTRLAFAGVEYVLLAAVMGFVTAPLRLALRSGFRILGQGTFMGMASPLALLLTYPLAAGLLLDYLGFLARLANFG
ncbi:MAG: hypothetical protein ACYDBQ_07770 [Thermoplasmatota archaeon]